MKTGKRWMLLLLGITLAGCGGSKSVVSAQKQEALDAMVGDRNFTIEAEWAQPMMTNAMTQIANSGLMPPGSGAGRINLIGTANYLTMKGDSVMAALPYFGERQMGGSYNGRDGGIQFEGIPEELEITKDDANGRYSVNFRINDKSERYQVKIELFPSHRSTILVNSSQRFVIRYDGEVESLKSDEG